MSSKAKQKNVNSEEDQLSLKEVLERVEAMNLQNKEENRDMFNTVGEKFVLFEKRLYDLQEGYLFQGLLFLRLGGLVIQSFYLFLKI